MRRERRGRPHVCVEVVIRMLQLVHRGVLSQRRAELFPAVIPQGVKHLQIAANERRLSFYQIFLGYRCVAEALG